MKLGLVLLCILPVVFLLPAKNVYIVDWVNSLKECSSTRTFNDLRCAYDTVLLKSALEKKGFAVYLVHADSKITNPDVIVWFDTCGVHPENITLAPHTVRVVFEREPPIVVPNNFDVDFLKNFDLVATWHDDFIDNQKFFKIYYPVSWLMVDDIVSFAQRKFGVLINKYMIQANDPHTYGSTGYGERQRAIDFFERFHPDQFEFYGLGWEHSIYKKYKTYKGVIPAGKKIDYLKHYKFCICYENSRCQGYITEKIFDCFQAGCVPVYLGPSNVGKYIPENCYIPLARFKNYKELYRFLNKIDETVYEHYLTNIRNFLTSEQSYVFTGGYYFKTCEKIVDLIDEKLAFKKHVYV